jgi:hypothetical protein
MKRHKRSAKKGSQAENFTEHAWEAGRSSRLAASEGREAAERLGEEGGESGHRAYEAGASPMQAGPGALPPSEARGPFLGLGPR